MRYFLFRIVAAIVNSLISVGIAVGTLITQIIAGFFNLIISCIRFVGTRLMIFIDKDRYEHAKLATEQYTELSELNLLIEARFVKEDALKNRVWTIAHTVAFNRIGSTLYTKHGWEPARISKYLGSLVQSIPGMVYRGGDDFDDEGVTV